MGAPILVLRSYLLATALLFLLGLPTYVLLARGVPLPVALFLFLGGYAPLALAEFYESKDPRFAWLLRGVSLAFASSLFLHAFI